MAEAPATPYSLLRKLRRPLVTAGLGLLAALFWPGCSSSPETMKAKLDQIAKEDLQGIMAEIPDKARHSVLARPYYVIDQYQEFHGDTAIVFQAMTTVVYFYLDPSLDLCQVRKYRYKRSDAMWDRYDVELKHIPEKYAGSPAP